jgi:erythromycin esterase-like protein
VEQVRLRSLPLERDDDLNPLLDQIGDARLVLLGEATHGTAEFYTWRARLSRRLIETKGFSFVAVEGDWPDCYRVNRFVKGGEGGTAREVLHAFERWPTWMWANTEVADFADWLRGHNRDRPAARRAGFYGLDVYSLWDSLYQVMAHLRQAHPEALDVARRAYQCFEPYGEDEQAYARATRWVPEVCEQEVVDLLAALRQGPAPRNDDPEAHFVAEQNALVVRNAEAYYRAMVRGGPDSWNVRDRHMAETLDRLLRHHGSDAKAIVWEHNTHVGDARFTDMADDGMVNLGQLARDGHASEGVVLVGFGTHRGTVIAGREWDAPMERLEVPPAREGSWEDALHRAGPRDKLLLFRDADASHEMRAWRGHRAIGVVYHPEYEHLGNYVPTVLPRRYDAFLFVDRSEAVHPLHLRARTEDEIPETYPWAV